MDCSLFFNNSKETCSKLKPGEKYSKNDNRPMNAQSMEPKNTWQNRPQSVNHVKKQSMLNSALKTASSKDEMRNQTSEKLSM